MKIVLCSFKEDGRDDYILEHEEDWQIFENLSISFLITTFRALRDKILFDPHLRNMIPFEM